MTEKKFHPITFDPPPYNEGEPHFRRGYHKGMFAMLQAVRSGTMTLDQLEEFVEGTVKDWRYSHTPSFPPEIS